MKVTLNTERFGAVVTDLPADLRDMTPADQRQLKDAFTEHGLLVLRGRPITTAEQISFSSTLGTLIDQAGQGDYWFNLTNLGGGYDGPLCFHADFSNNQGLLSGACLYASVLPNGPTATIFADTGAAYADLPAEMLERIADLRSVHAAVVHGTVVDAPLRHRPETACEPRAEHPLVLRHPDTGKPMLFVSDMQTERILGLPKNESDALLNELAAWIQQDKYVYRHQWQLHDLVAWDQVMMQHSRASERVEGERTLRRTSFTHPLYAERCQARFDSMGGRGGRSGSQAKVMA